jgi:hypothetical protein
MKSKGIATFCLCVSLSISLCGCLSLQFGGKTHNCNGSKEADARIAQLENRLDTVERRISVNVSKPIVEIPSDPTTHDARLPNDPSVYYRAKP